MATPSHTPSPTPPAPLPASTTTPAPAPGPTAADAWSSLPQLEGNLANQVEGLEDGMPRAGSEGFVLPTVEEIERFGALVTAIEAGDAGRAQSLAAGLGYELLRYVDHGDSAAQSLLLRETRSGAKGWGLYAFRLLAGSRVVVEAPHPLYDEGTPAVALDAYRTLGARALLVAGAQRDANADGAADVAHNRRTIFQAVHAALARAQDPIVLQFHGFAAGKHPGYPPIVLGSDQPAADALLPALRQALEGEGVDAGLCDGGAWRELCGETNVQSATMASGIFIHLELDESLRGDDRTLLGALRRLVR